MITKHSELLDSVIRLAFLEDIGNADVTSSLTIPADATALAYIIAKEDFILAGMPFVSKVFEIVDTHLRCDAFAQEGQPVLKDSVIARVQGNTCSILASERLVLNILQRVSGIATLTNRFVQKVADLPVLIADTRKTAPCCRIFDKYGVKMGGGANHRFGLYDGILIKDNHIRACGGIAHAIAKARHGHHLLKIEVEVSSLAEVQDALEAKADVIMLDNMDINTIKEAVKMINKKALVEVSGGISIQNVRQYAETGVDIISIGALTHSVTAVDISMKVQ